MVKELQELEQQLGKRRNFDSPPLHQWHPPLSGDIAIRISADGTWYHEGGKIERESLVRVFASILRREEDGGYYLVTPVEKWRIEVELHALMVTDVEVSGGGDEQLLRATLNTGKQVDIGRDHSLFLEPSLGGIAAIKLDHGLTALFTRAAWYRLVEMAEEGEGGTSVRSGGSIFRLSAE